MRRLAPLLLFLLPALAQKLVLGLALEGQALPIGLAGFARLEQGGYLLEARAGWELLGGVFVGLEGGVYLDGGHALQVGLLFHPYHEALQRPNVLSATLGFTNRSWNTDLPLWGGVALPLDPAFWEGVDMDALGLGFIALLRLRVYLEPPGF
ncbi:hypothetical protein TthAA37_20210 [Thermus thermophilus]|uniref:hypothetical protein n=1 Tax=Thermus thermophilus TaxID=274 RepID=UPI001C796CB3|nr:hypothetical protein [Thermus thermophilus]BCZ90159.1 hypothetical protein TthAA22_19640 [Thermus thermophilus]BCZ92832.1 hypothetical protein TthAA37_20210 [Thermus thermophilus]